MTSTNLFADGKQKDCKFLNLHFFKSCPFIIGLPEKKTHERKQTNSLMGFPGDEDLQHRQTKLSMNKKIQKNTKKIHKKGSKKKNAYSSNKDNNKKGKEAEEISQKSATSLRQSGNTKKTHEKRNKKKNVYSSGKGKKAKEISKKAAASLKQSGSGCLVANCLDLAVSYINLLRTKVANYQKQVARLGKLNAATLVKFAKQNSFARTVDHLVAAGGGDLRNLSCGSSTNNTGA
jgi:hypothetical protein